MRGQLAGAGTRGRDDVLIWGGRATLNVDSSGSSGEDDS